MRCRAVGGGGRNGSVVVAGDVAEVIVDLLEVVEVDHGDGVPAGQRVISEATSFKIRQLMRLVVQIGSWWLTRTASCPRAASRIPGIAPGWRGGHIRTAGRAPAVGRPHAVARGHLVRHLEQQHERQIDHIRYNHARR